MSDTGTDRDIALIRRYLSKTQLKPAHFAKIAGLDHNALRRVDEDDWNPTIETVRKLVAAIPEEFKIGSAAA